PHLRSHLQAVSTCLSNGRRTVTLSQFLPVTDAETIVLDFGVFVAERARTFRTSQSAIIAALRPCITPSQPGETSRSHAPAADTSESPSDVATDGGHGPASPSVDHIPESTVSTLTETAQGHPEVL